MNYNVDLHFARQYKLPVERIPVEAPTKAEARLEAERIAKGYGLPAAKKIEVFTAREEVPA
jgi:hypothetical protein